MKAKRGFAKCPIRGCKAHAVFTVGVRMLGGYPMVGVMSDDRIVWADDASFPRACREAGAYCEQHEATMKIRLLKAHYVSDVECTDKCKTAVGPNCECSCSGRNHGAAADTSLT